MDHLTGTEAEDELVDGTGNDDVSAAGGDDAVPNNEGADKLYAESGEDLFIYDAVCEGDLLTAARRRDNANWANFDESPVSLDMEASRAGLVGAGGRPDCGGDPETTLHNLEDIEATNLEDTLIGDAGEQPAAGPARPRLLLRGPGNDTILANSGTPNRIPIRRSTAAKASTRRRSTFRRTARTQRRSTASRSSNCPRTASGRRRRRRAPSRTPLAGAGGPRAPVDETPPQTTLQRRPPHMVYTRRAWRRVSFVFTSNEPASSFRCRLDSQPVQGVPLTAPLPGRARPPHVPRLRDRRGGQPRPHTRRLPIRRRGSATAGAEAAVAAARLAKRLHLDRLGQARSARSPAARSGRPARP